VIQSFSVYGLHNRTDHEIELNPDLNILTGRNGSGKTTLLKLLWYMVSPNVERTVPEIAFREALVITDEFKLSIRCKSRENRSIVLLSFTQPNKEEFVGEVWADDFPDSQMDPIDEINRRIDSLQSGSVFFPTFRRIEGGFSISDRHHVNRNPLSGTDKLLQAMSSYASTMSVGNHKFIASISTEDIEQLLTSQYADVSERTNNLHFELSNFISKKVSPNAPTSKTDKRAAKELIEALTLLHEIRTKLARVDSSRTELMKPFNVLSNLIINIFKDKGIKVSKNLTFGETKRAIRAGILSAGEKQMLSFLCYNAFVAKSPIFIDEPELSLHGDWQRTLFPTLLSQETSNQFIVSTHSPFIYSKYPEKEILLDSDRGA
jgi:predicted ATP-binding protein involved in virulence